MDDWRSWLLTPDGRIAAAGLLFAAIWAIKNLAIVKAKILTTDRRRLIASAIVSMAPAAVMLADPSVPAGEAWRFALWTWLGAMGLQSGAKAALGQGVASKLKIRNGGDAPPDKPEGEGGKGKGPDAK